jgi:hypothetical protein
VRSELEIIERNRISVPQIFKSYLSPRLQSFASDNFIGENFELVSIENAAGTNNDLSWLFVDPILTERT